MNDLPNAVAYCRVAPHESESGLEIQRKAIENFAQREGFPVIQWFAEVAKGSEGPELRPKLAQALFVAKKLKIPLLVNKVDRLSRSFHFVTGLMERKSGVKFIVTNEGRNADPFTLHVLSAMADRVRGDD